MNLYDIQNCCFEEGCKEYWRPAIDEDRIVDYIIQFAYGAMDCKISTKEAELIWERTEEFLNAGNGTNDHYYMIEKPLSKMEAGE
jgi:hypothetical protein